MNAPARIPEPTLAKLREPFPANQISKLPKPLKRDSQKGKCSECGGYHALPAVHLDYVGHAALTDRLLDTDEQWTWEPLALDERGLPAFDNNGGLWIKLTVLGVTRLGYGSADGKTGGDAKKEIIGDALRNAAMRFGAALDLWHKGDLHAEEESEPNSPGRDIAGERKMSPAGADDYTPLEPRASEVSTVEYKFPDGPAKNITGLKSLARNLWREIEGCGDDGELNGLLYTDENRAIVKQLSELENPAHREIWEGDGKDNPGISGLITRKQTEFANRMVDYVRAG